jgi:hypothetical protein
MDMRRPTFIGGLAGTAAALARVPTVLAQDLSFKARTGTPSALISRRCRNP